MDDKTHKNILVAVLLQLTTEANLTTSFIFRKVPALFPRGISPYEYEYVSTLATSCPSINCLWGNVYRYSNRKEKSCLPLLNAGFEPRVSDTKSPAAPMPTDKPTELLRIKLKTWTRQPHYDQRAFGPLDPTISWLSDLSYLWRYTCWLL